MKDVTKYGFTAIFGLVVRTTLPFIQRGRISIELLKGYSSVRQQHLEVILRCGGNKTNRLYIPKSNSALLLCPPYLKNAIKNNSY